jgi:signal transduction histidine kinase
MPEELLSHYRATGAGMGVGIGGIRERAWELGGRLEVESDGSGTLLRVAVPIPQKTQNRLLEQMGGNPDYDATRFCAK